MPKQIDVVGAVIVRDGLVFCAQRGASGALAGKWEFPGGKMEPGESAPEALRREIREELSCEVLVGKKLTTTSFEYDFGTVNLTTFYCELVEGDPVLSEHNASRWLSPTDFDSVDWAPADVPAVLLAQQELSQE